MIATGPLGGIFTVIGGIIWKVSVKEGHKQYLWSPIHLISAKIRAHPLSVEEKRDLRFLFPSWFWNSLRVQLFSSLIFWWWWNIGCLHFCLPCVKQFLVVSSTYIERAKYAERELNCQRRLFLFFLIGLCNSLQASFVYWCFIEIRTRTKCCLLLNISLCAHIYLWMYKIFSIN